MKKISTARSSTIDAIDTVIEMCGTNSGPIDTSAAVAYTKLATKVPSVTWVPRSRMKVRNMRGPNCVEASVKATIVIEKTTPTTVMMAAAMAVSTCRAESGVPKVTQFGIPSSP